MSRQITGASRYSDKLVQLIPSEMVGAYITIQEFVLDTPSYKDPILLISAFMLLVAIPFYLWRVQSVRSRLQIAVTMISFIVWVFSVGGRYIDPIATEAVWRSLVLVLWTTIVPIFYVRAQD